MVNQKNIRMKTLYVVRHAKSSWSNKSLADVDRPLKGRGVNDAYGTSQWLVDNNAVPDLLISSPATRALHTAMIFARTFDIDFSAIQIDGKLYEGNAKNYRHCVNQISDDYASAMIFGHNPSIGAFINSFADKDIAHVPTTGIACITFDLTRWKDIDKEGKLIFFDYPKRRH